MGKQISILGVPMNFGQGNRGVELGPNAIRIAGVVEKLEDLHHKVNDHGDLTAAYTMKTPALQSNLRNLNQVVKINEQVAIEVDKIIGKGNFPLILGGDHSIAIGTLAGIAKHYKNLGVIWYDAHGDLNNAETSPSGNIHGMSLAVSLGVGHRSLTNIHGYENKIKAENIVLIGCRSLDVEEKALIQQRNIKVYTMHDIDQLGMAKVIAETIHYFNDQQTDGIHLSFDLDGLDPLEAPGVGTPSLGGITYRESRLAMEMFAKDGKITSAEFVEVNPVLDNQNITATVAVALIGSLFGETFI